MTKLVKVPLENTSYLSNKAIATIMHQNTRDKEDRLINTFLLTSAIIRQQQ